MEVRFRSQKVCPALPPGRWHKKILCAFHCTGHSDEPLKTKIVFSIGFHDFRVSSPSYKSYLHNIFLCHRPGGSAGQTF